MKYLFIIAVISLIYLNLTGCASAPPVEFDPPHDEEWRPEPRFPIYAKV